MNIQTFVLCCFFAAVNLNCQSQNAGEHIASLEFKLKSGSLTVSDILKDPVYMDLHANTAFRELIKNHVKAGEVTITTDTEPGTKITINGMIIDGNGAAIK